MQEKKDDEILIFLGAGASKELGIKTMQELTEDVMKLLKQYGYKEETNEIVSSLKECGITPDFEAIFSVIEGLKDVVQGIKQAGPFAAYVCKELTSIQGIPDSKRILNELKKLIFEECSKVKKNKLEEVFNPLFKLTPDLHNANWIPVATRIVTTNYDMSVELYHWKKEMPFSDGFTSTRNPFIHTYSASIPVIKSSTDGRSYASNQGKLLIKLHGSIWYFKQGPRLIETITDPKSHDILMTSEIGEQIMIYPTKEKPILRYPFYDFFKAFKEQNWNFLVVIGYSFRDEPVNTILLEQIQRTQNPHVFVVDPNAETTLENFAGYEEYASCFHTIELEFGKEGYANELFQAINPYLGNYSY